VNGERWVRRFQVKRLKVAFHSPPACPLFHSPFFLSSPSPISRIRALSRIFHFLCLALHSCNLELGIWSLVLGSVLLCCPPVFYPHRSIHGNWSLEIGAWLCPRRGRLGEPTQRARRARPTTPHTPTRKLPATPVSETPPHSAPPTPQCRVRL